MFPPEILIHSFDPHLQFTDRNELVLNFWLLSFFLFRGNIFNCCAVTFWNILLKTLTFSSNQIQLSTPTDISFVNQIFECFENKTK